jgi:hypothetical protein
VYALWLFGITGLLDSGDFGPYFGDRPFWKPDVLGILESWDFGTFRPIWD